MCYSNLPSKRQFFFVRPSYLSSDYWFSHPRVLSRHHTGAPYLKDVLSYLCAERYHWDSISNCLSWVQSTLSGFYSPQVCCLQSWQIKLLRLRSTWSRACCMGRRCTGGRCSTLTLCSWIRGLLTRSDSWISCQKCSPLPEGSRQLRLLITYSGCWAERWDLNAPTSLGQDKHAILAWSWWSSRIEQGREREG